ncbi:MAG: metalloregulator ArsR/SmtB family transcription factor [candidate division NC10 bacterium]
MPAIDDQVYALHASVCQTLANPTRLKILNALRDQEIPVTERARRTGTSMPNLSQHLAILRQRRVVLTRREGVTIYYRIANAKILQAFDIMRDVLFEQLSEGRRLVAAVDRARRGGARR